MRNPPPERHRTLPWYREPWPWVLFSLPLSAVLAGFVTLAIALKHDDGLVAEDYYKRGLAMNRRLALEQHAVALGLQARVNFEEGRVIVQLSGAVDPGALRLRFVHPTRAANDREVAAMRRSARLYEASLPALRESRWRVQLEDREGTWRLNGEWGVARPFLQLTSIGLAP